MSTAPLPRVLTMLIVASSATPSTFHLALGAYLAKDLYSGRSQGLRDLVRACERASEVVRVDLDVQAAITEYFLDI